MDIGTTTAKTVVFNNGKFICSRIVRAGTNPALAGKQVLEAAINDVYHANSDVKYIVATGYGRVLALFADKIVTEITCYGYGWTSYH